jgi:pimeloyl-ACP methyl ester carboxylesterase
MGDRFVEVAGRRLRVRVQGPAQDDGPVVVLEAGGGAPGVESWEGVDEQLAARTTVVTYDRAGIGRSDPPSRPPTAQDMADDLLAVLDACVAGRKAVLVGFSLGGLVVELLAGQHPERVSGLVLVDPTAHDAYDARRSATRLVDPAALLTGAFLLLARTGLLRRRRGRAIVERYVGKQLGGTADPDAARRMSEALSSPGFWRGVRLETARLRESCAQASRSLAEVGLPDVPLQVLTAGERSGAALATRETHAGLAGSVLQGRLVVVEGAPHNIVAVRPDTLVAAVVDVLS